MNDYFTFTPLTPYTLARASTINAAFSALEGAFDRLPDPEKIAQDRVSYVTGSGTGTAIIAALTPAIEEYVEGLRLRLKVLATNGGPATINVNGLGAKEIRRGDGTALLGGELITGAVADLTYDGTRFRLPASSIQISQSQLDSIQAALASNYATVASVNEQFDTINDTLADDYARLDGAAFTGNVSVAGTTKLTGDATVGADRGIIAPNASTGANWADRDATFMSSAKDGLIALAGFSRGSDQSGTPTECIGAAGFVIADHASRPAWGLYSDVQYQGGQAAQYAYGLEIAVKNKTAFNLTSTPYFATTGTYGIWLPAGGDPSYGGAAVSPNNTAIAIGKNGSTWNKGIVFFKDGLTGTDGTTGTATAIEMAKGHIISWRAPGNNQGALIYSQVATAGKDVQLIFADDTVSFGGASGANIFQFGHVASGVNYLTCVNAISGAGPSLIAQGASSNIDLSLTPKGSGKVNLGSIVKITPLTTTQINALVSPDQGTTCFNTTIGMFVYYSGGWKRLHDNTAM